MVDAGSSEQKAIVGSLNKIVSIWLYNTQEALVPSKSPTLPAKLIKNGWKKEKLKGKGKIKIEIKSELSTRAKRSRAISAEMSLPKRSGLVTRQKTKLLEGLESSVSEDGAGEYNAIYNIAMEAVGRYHSLPQLIDGAEGSGGKELPVS